MIDLKSISKEELQEIINSNNSYVDILKVFGMDGYNGGGYKTLKKRISDENLSIDLLKRNRKKFLSDKGLSQPIDNSIIFKENSEYTNRTNIKTKLIRDFNFAYECVDCGIGEYYNSKPISLQLDHINGISNDNRIDNLRFLCPNCHSQTETYAGKQKKKVNFCECGKLIKCSSTKCRKCRGKSGNPRINWPTDDDLKKFLTMETLSQLSKRLGVSKSALVKKVSKIQ